MLEAKRKKMTSVMDETVSFDDISLGMTAKIQRALQRLTKEEVAGIAGVSKRDVGFFESNQPLPRLAQLKLLNAYNIIIQANIARASS